MARSRASILKAAVELLAEQGFGATSIEAISERSGVAKTTIYRHWDNKAALVLDVIDSLIEDPVDPNTGSLEGDLAALAEGLARGLREGPWAAILPSLVEAAERDADLARMSQEFTAARHAMVKRIVARARSREEIRPEVDDDDIIELVAGPLFYRRLVTGQRIDHGHAVRLARLVADLAAPR